MSQRSMLMAGAAKSACRDVRLVSAAAWASLALVTCSSPPVRPDWAAWCLRLVTGDWAGENALLVAEFNLMGLWPLLICAQLRHGMRTSTPPLWPFAVGSFCLGCFSMALGLIILAESGVIRPLGHARAASASASASGSTPPAARAWAVRVLAHPGTHAAMLAGSAALMVWGGARGDAAAFRAAINTEGFANIMTWDFVAFWAISASVARAVDRTTEQDGGRAAGWGWTTLPLVGSCIWLYRDGAGRDTKQE